MVIVTTPPSVTLKPHAASATPAITHDRVVPSTM